MYGGVVDDRFSLWEGPVGQEGEPKPCMNGGQFALRLAGKQLPLCDCVAATQKRTVLGIEPSDWALLLTSPPTGASRCARPARAGLPNATPSGRGRLLINQTLPLPLLRVARIVPEFCARTTPETRATPCPHRNKRFLVRGVFWLLDCCTNAASDGNQNRSSRQDAKGTKKTGPPRSYPWRSWRLCARPNPLSFQVLCHPGERIRVEKRDFSR